MLRLEYLTSFVHYKCMVKPRRALAEADQELRRRLQAEQRAGDFQAHSCGIGDLQDVKLLESRKRLGMGEISSIAFAMKIGQAVLTNDQKARKLAEATGLCRPLRTSSRGLSSPGDLGTRTCRWCLASTKR